MPKRAPSRLWQADPQKRGTDWHAGRPPPPSLRHSQNAAVLRETEDLTRLPLNARHLVCVPCLEVHVSRLEQLTPDSLEVLRLLDPPIEMLIVGTGRTLLPLPPATEEWLAAHCIAPELLPTRHACSTFNFMGAEGRQVAAVLFPPVDPFADAALEAGPAAGEIT